jgi:hypothetical protein
LRKNIQTLSILSSTNCHSPHSLASVKDMYVEMGFQLNLYRQGIGTAQPGGYQPAVAIINAVIGGGVVQGLDAGGRVKGIDWEI